MFGFFNKITNSLKGLIFDKNLNQDNIESLKNIFLPILGTYETNELLEKVVYSESYDKAIDKISNHITDILVDLQVDIDFFQNHKKEVILLCGVNGAGKTTIAGKISHYFKQNYKKSTLLAACDMFRAAAAEQLKIIADISDSEFLSQDKGDSASMGYKAINYISENNIDCAILDTSGRLENNKNLMLELKKTYQVILKKKTDDMRINNILVLDALLGSNTIEQIKNFHEAISLNGLIINKVDNTTMLSGVVIKIVKEFGNKIPIFFLGYGENMKDIKLFNAKEFVDFSLKKIK